MPEPATVLALASGGLLAIRRRRRGLCYRPNYWLPFALA
ncbi:MAG: PEP-CTERM sorting domain-containing protein [Phycisphaerae bacterium]|nr:PEP-CTERM sorting domain-containing protein [Phycisphaerae bacterium]